MHEIETNVHVDVNARKQNTARRNISLGLALVLFALSCVYITGEQGLIWMMWRDAPAISLLLAGAAAFFAVRWWRTPRS